MNLPLKSGLLAVLLLAIAASAGTGLALAQTQQPNREQARGQAGQTLRLAQEVNHQLLLLPFLSVFDNLKYDVRGSVVTLAGQVTQPATKHDAAQAVKGIEGVTQVVDQIEVLPVSPMDDQLRRQVYRAIYGDPALERYAMGALQPIHIIVKGGHVTLEGVVDNDMDKQIAQTRALGVSTAFSVDNHLQVLHHA